MSMRGMKVCHFLMSHRGFLRRIFRVITLKTLVLATHMFVFSRTQHFCHIWKTHTCVDSAQVLVLEKSTQVLCDACSNTPKSFLPPTRGERSTSSTTGGCLIHWAITDTPYGDTIIILIITLAIIYIRVKLLYINMFTCR